MICLGSSFFCITKGNIFYKKVEGWVGRIGHVRLNSAASKVCQALQEIVISV